MIIKKGKHHIEGWKFFPFLFKRNFTIVFKLDDSCKYNGSDQLNEQWNKLYGIGAIWHHWKSDRIVWRYKESFDMFELGRYNYRKGKRQPVKSLGFIRPNSWKKLKVITSFYFIGKRLNPYFGGTIPAQEDLNIKVSEI